MNNVPSILRRWWVFAMCIIMPLFSQAHDTDSTRLMNTSAIDKEQPSKFFFFIPVSSDKASFDEALASFTKVINENLHGITSLSVKFNHSLEQEELMTTVSKNLLTTLDELNVPTSMITYTVNLQDVETPYVAIVLVVQPNS